MTRRSGEADRLPDTGLPVEVSRVTTAVVPIGPSCAGFGALTVTVEFVAETVSVPKVTLAVFEITVLSVVSVAVKVAVSAAGSLTVNVAWPDDRSRRASLSA